MKLVEEKKGIGALRWRGNAYASVAYSVSRYQAMTSAGLPVPGLHRIEGHLDIDALPDGAEMAGGSVVLELEDGRSMNLTVVDDSGSVLAEGHGPSKCMCC